jgi:hypothetical protein
VHDVLELGMSGHTKSLCGAKALIVKINVGWAL